MTAITGSRSRPRWRPLSRWRSRPRRYARGPVPDPAVKDFQRVVDAAYAKYKDLKDGKNADYIPILTETPSDLFGVVIVTKDGKVYSAGDVDYKFSIQSVSKPFTAALVMSAAGPGGAEGEDRRRADRHGVQLEAGARGLRELGESAGERGRDRGREPGEGHAPRQDRWNKVSQNLSDFAGRPLTVLEKVYESEYTTAFGNRGIANLLYNWGRLYSDPEEALRVYTRECSVGVSAKDLGMMGATLANGGVNPLTRQAGDAGRARAGTPGGDGHGRASTTSRAMWMYKAGLPAKTGVGGGIVAVVPGRFAIAAFSPRLNEAGNSVRSMKAIQRHRRRARRRACSGRTRTDHARAGVAATFAASSNGNPLVVTGRGSSAPALFHCKARCIMSIPESVGVQRCWRCRRRWPARRARPRRSRSDCSSSRPSNRR